MRFVNGDEELGIANAMACGQSMDAAKASAQAEELGRGYMSDEFEKTAKVCCCASVGRTIEKRKSVVTVTDASPMLEGGCM